jgi:hypothetical protein
MMMNRSVLAAGMGENGGRAGHEPPVRGGNWAMAFLCVVQIGMDIGREDKHLSVKKLRNFQHVLTMTTIVEAGDASKLQHFK